MCLLLLQVRRLLRAEGLTGNGGGGKRRQQRPGGSSDDDDDADGWDSTAEGGDVLLGVEKQQMERLYAQHLADEDYLAKVGNQRVLWCGNSNMAPSDWLVVLRQPASPQMAMTTMVVTAALSGVMCFCGRGSCCIMLRLQQRPLLLRCYACLFCRLLQN